MKVFSKNEDGKIDRVVIKAESVLDATVLEILAMDYLSVGTTLVVTKVDLVTKEVEIKKI